MKGWSFLNNKKKVNVLTALCVHRGVDPDCWESLQFLSKIQEPKFHVRFKAGDALIDRSRAYVATRFLERKEYDILLFIDDDIVFSPDAAVKSVKLITEGGLDIVGAPYVKKQADNNHFNIKTLNGEAMKFGEQGGVYEVKNISTGFMAISRKVLEKMAETLPLCHPKDLRFYPFFTPYPKQIEDGTYVYLSEDWAFCQKARDLGFKVWLDTTSKIIHAGRYLYDWNDIFRENKPKVKNFEYGDVDGVPFHELTDEPISGKALQG